MSMRPAKYETQTANSDRFGQALGGAQVRFLPEEPPSGLPKKSYCPDSEGEGRTLRPKVSPSAYCTFRLRRRRQFHKEPPAPSESAAQSGMCSRTFFGRTFRSR